MFLSLMPCILFAQGPSNDTLSTCSSESFSQESSLDEYFPCSSDWNSASSDNFSSDLDCFQAHYLEEEPERPPAARPMFEEDHHNDVPHDPELEDHGLEDPHDPDDPNDPDDPRSSSSESSSDESEDGDVHQVANLHNNILNRNVNLIRNCSKAEIILLE